MNNLELHFIETKTLESQLVNTAALVQATEFEYMEPLNVDVMNEHVAGLLLVDGYQAGTPALGYVACKKILRVGLDGPEVLIGGLYLAPGYRGQGLAASMVRSITDRAFRFNGTTACIANCNQASGPVFESAGYKTHWSHQEGKTRYRLAQKAWISQK